MPAIAVVIGAIASYSGVTAAISAAIFEITGSALIASIGSGAIIGAGAGAVSAAAQGGDIAQGALVGGLTGGVGGGISNVIGGTLSSPGPGQYGPQLATGSPSLDAGIIKGVTGATTGALGAALTGKDPLRAALLGGASGGISAAAGNALGFSPTGTSALGSALGFGLSSAFPEEQKTQTRSVSTRTPYQPTVSGQNTKRVLGTGAPMGSALSIGSGIDYTPSSTVFGSGESDKPKSDVWIVESLKGGAVVGPNVS
jgi:hypothetical protein